MKKLNLCCGKDRKIGYVGVDQIPFEGVDVVSDIFAFLVTYPSGIVEEILLHHAIEHFNTSQRKTLIEECYRVLQPGGVLHVTCPDFSCAAAYGDPDHKWPPMSVYSFYYYNEEWRKDNAPHCDYNCNFSPEIQTEYFKDIDMKILSATLTKI